MLKIKLLKIYLDELESIPKLSEKELLKLWRRYKKGDKLAKEKLIETNLRLVIPIAKKFTFTGMDLLELIQVGNIGLIKAIENYNPNKKIKFTSYASYWIEQSIRKSTDSSSRVIKIPPYMWMHLRKWIKKWRIFYEKKGRYPSLQEMEKELNLTSSEITNIIKSLELSTGILYLDTMVDEEGGYSLKDIIPDKSKPLPFETVSESLKSEEMKKLLKNLEPLERKIIRLRYGKVPLTLVETGKVVNLSRERVRQIEMKALKKLKWLSQKITLVKKYL